MLPRPQDKERSAPNTSSAGVRHQAQGISVSAVTWFPAHPLVVTSLGPHHLLSLSFPACEMGTLALNLDIVPGQKPNHASPKLGVEKVASWV